MILKDKEIEINNIWAKDKLNRKGYADFLYKIIESAQTSEEEDNALIFAIDGEWGTGKSFFIDLWIKDLKAKGHLVSRFDAWKNDIVDEPLVGFLSHIYTDLGDWDEKIVVKVVDETIKKSQKLLLPLAKELLKGAAIKGLGALVTDTVAEKAFDAITEGYDTIVEDELKDEQSMSSMLIHRQLQAHNKNIQLIEDFKNKLSEVAGEVIGADNKKSPVFIFIDELDRCRPDYAVRLLEVVKHIFNSKGICFLSSVNIIQLQESIKTIYGLNFESDKYLDRFFSHRLKLPAPSTKDYIASLPLFIKIRDNKTRFSYEINLDEEVILNFYSRICNAHCFDLRTIKSLFHRLDICRSILEDEILESNYDELIFIILSLIKSNNFGHQVFENALSFSDYEINNFDFFLIDQTKKNPDLVSIKYGDLVRLIKKIHIEHQMKDHNRYRTFSIDQDHQIYNLVLSTWGATRGNEEVALRKMHKYVEVCAMSGRLDE